MNMNICGDDIVYASVEANADRLTKKYTAKKAGRQSVYVSDNKKLLGQTSCQHVMTRIHGSHRR